MDLTDTIVPRSDQLNADDLISGPRTVTITDVRRGSDEQPVNIHLAEFPGRPFRPSKTVLRILIAAWDKESDAYIGRRLTLYRDPQVRFGGQDVGGIRVSHMSHIAKPMKLALTETRGKKVTHIVQPLKEEARPDYMADARAAESRADLRKVWQRAKDAGHLTDALNAELAALGEGLPATVEQPADELPLDGAR